MAAIRYWHFRLWSWPLRDLQARGGATVCAIIEGQKARLGVAVCSLKDTYCKTTGRYAAYEYAEAVPDLTLEPLPEPRVLAGIATAMARARMTAIHKGKGGTFE